MANESKVKLPDTCIPLQTKNLERKEVDHSMKHPTGQLTTWFILYALMGKSTFLHMSVKSLGFSSAGSCPPAKEAMVADRMKVSRRGPAKMALKVEKSAEELKRVQVRSGVPGVLWIPL